MNRRRAAGALAGTILLLALVWTLAPGAGSSPGPLVAAQARFTSTVPSGQVGPVPSAIEPAEPWIQASPPVLDISVEAESQLTATLLISNVGPVELLVSLIEEIPAGTAAAVAAAGQDRDSVQAATRVESPFRVDDAVSEALRAPGGATDFFIWMRERADLSRAPQISGKEARGRFVFEALTRAAERSQAAIRRLEGFRHGVVHPERGLHPGRGLD